ncbi:peptidylprolyl isomerase [Dissulfurirhabdus thermomarina]|uniref:Peptidyl-prolyl cis-trans isomerase n=1 Tax=Dissulfurirhabdus thermomarina TaxID=1765737 RepID=A0A6N9TNZ9_DISTH|nr:peptidylprolyl isomerase [Dissulfurirhabdus thermomarina]NDY42985.1 peptidylprolyl isomerase [Dissulfurirhabdus thermomarina]NMX22723.1 peptidylprolyl isomerase [Dissulfurirhabdus thermomarina]
MKIADRTYVAIDYTLALDSGEVIDRSEPGSPLGFITGVGQIIPGLERQLMGMEAGQNAQITVEAAEAYGERNEALYREIPRQQFPSDIEVQAGMNFETMGPSGPIRFTVRSVTDEMVVADFNHPLAGERLHFDITVSEVREPSEAEMAALAGLGGCASGACDSGCGGGCC